MNNKDSSQLGKVFDAEELPKEETQRRWNETTSQWPIMHAVIKGVSQNQERISAHYYPMYAHASSHYTEKNSQNGRSTIQFFF